MLFKHGVPRARHAGNRLSLWTDLSRWLIGRIDILVVVFVFPRDEAGESHAGARNDYRVVSARE